MWRCCLAVPPPIHSVYDMASIVLVQYNEIRCFLYIVSYSYTKLNASVVRFQHYMYFQLLALTHSLSACS